MSTEAPMAQRPDACPDPEQLAAYIDGGLPAEERTLVERHLAECQECRDIIGGSVESLDEIREDLARQDHQSAAPQAPPIRFPPPSPPKPPRAKWFIAASVVLPVAAAVMLVVWLRQPSPHYVPEMAEVVAAVGSSRPLEPRLTGGFGYGPPPEVTRGGTDPKVSPPVMAAAARVLTATANRTEPNAQAASGVASLLLGEPAAGVQALEDASRADRASPRILSDLAAAYLVRWKSGGTDVDLTRALDAAEHATRLPNAPTEAWFNRALALEALGPERGRAGWQDYLIHDSNSPWADEAKRRLDRLPRTSGRALWLIDLERALTRTDLDDVDRLVQSRPDFARDYLDELVTDRAPPSAERAIRVEHIARPLTETTKDHLPIALSRALRALPPDSEEIQTAHAGYRTARAEYDDDRVEDAARAFAALLPVFERYKHPYRFWCRFYVAIADFYRGQFDAARQQFTSLETEASAAGYEYLAGRAAWMVGLSSSFAVDLTRGEAAYRRALERFEAVRDAVGIASMRQSIAEIERLLGDPVSAWSDLIRALNLTPSIEHARTRQRVWAGAVVAALTDDLPFAAMAMQPPMAAAAAAWGRPAGIVDAYRLEGEMCAVIADTRCASRAIGAAQETQKQIHDGALRERSELNVALARATAALNNDPDAAVGSATRAIGLLEKHGGLRLAQAYLVRGRAYQRGGRLAEAERDYGAGIEIFEARRHELTDEQIRISYFDEAWQLFDGLIGLQWARGDTDAALTTAERGRARALADWIPDVSPRLTMGGLQARIPEHTTLLYYAVATPRIYVWALDRRNRSFAVIDDRDGSLMRLTMRFRSRLEAGQWDSAERAMASELFARLVRPHGLTIRETRRLVISPSGFLHQLPFAALIDPRTGHTLLETTEIAYCPSAALAFTARVSVSAGPALLLGDSTGDLTGAASEVEAIAGELPSAITKLGADASPAVLAALENYGVVHIATHADVNEERPFLSRLRLAGRPVFAYQLYGPPLDRTSLVVLSGCSTAHGQLRRGEGVLSLARPFLARGVPSVVATLWDIPDTSARALFIAFHRARARGVSDLAALRSAQLAMLSSGDPSSRSPRNWASVAVYSRVRALDDPIAEQK